MEHPKDREFRKEYEQAVASGATTESMARWMNDNAKNGLVKKLDAYCEHISARMAEEERKEVQTQNKMPFVPWLLLSIFANWAFQKIPI